MILFKELDLNARLEILQNSQMRGMITSAFLSLIQENSANIVDVGETMMDEADMGLLFDAIDNANILEKKDSLIQIIEAQINNIAHEAQSPPSGALKLGIFSSSLPGQCAPENNNPEPGFNRPKSS